MLFGLPEQTVISVAVVILIIIVLLVIWALRFPEDD
ncbi:hypothetical protein J2T61_000644 [Methanocalculus sp. AMF5]|nr:hypothetical protein [Methanocalculus sp. AMF5]